MNSTDLDLFFANPSDTRPVTPSPEVSPAKSAEGTPYSNPMVQSEPSPQPEFEPVGNPTELPGELPRQDLSHPTVPVVNPDQIELAREQREADRLARLAESRAAKQRMSRRTRASVRPPVAQMATQEPQPAQPAPALKPKTIEHPKLQPKPPARLRLDPTAGSEDEDEGRLGPTRWFLNLVTGPFRNFYEHCPSCGSNEIYAVNASGRFIRSKVERALLFQKLTCERCICAFTRPGLLLGAPTPKLRPADEELYS